MAFIIAERGEVFVKAVLAGQPGAGKSYTALKLASYLACYSEGIQLDPDTDFHEGMAGVVAVIESENRSREYAGGKPFYYSVEELVDYGPASWGKALEDARKSGFRAVVLDSMSDEWRGRGGCLQMVEDKGGKFDAWGAVKKEHWKLIEQIQNYPGHVICTVRSKTGIEIEEKNGRKVAVKTAAAPIQEEEFPYRLSHYFDMVFNEDTKRPELHVLKTVASTIANGEVYQTPGLAFAARLFQWCKQENDSPSHFKTARALLKNAKTIDDLGVIAKGVSENLGRYTLREVAVLREIGTARQLELIPGATATQVEGGK